MIAIADQARAYEPSRAHGTETKLRSICAIVATTSTSIGRRQRSLGTNHASIIETTFWKCFLVEHLT